MASRVATVVDEGLGQLFSMGYGEIYQSVEGFSSRVPKRYPLVERLSSQVQKIYRSVERFSSRVQKMFPLVERLSSQVQKIYQSVERFSSRVQKMYSLVERLSSRVENRDCLVALGPDARRAGAHTPIPGTGCRDDYPQKVQTPHCLPIRSQLSRSRVLQSFAIQRPVIGF